MDNRILFISDNLHHKFFGPCFNLNVAMSQIAKLLSIKFLKTWINGAQIMSKKSKSLILLMKWNESLFTRLWVLQVIRINQRYQHILPNYSANTFNTL